MMRQLQILGRPGICLAKREYDAPLRAEIIRCGEASVKCIFSIGESIHFSSQQKPGTRTSSRLYHEAIPLTHDALFANSSLRTFCHQFSIHVIGTKQH
ncbi:hypothetical protein D1646_19790 [Pseudoflavonifractor sp. 60]|nr:hypothetical protein [Pseudoflavonifractor sp. 60]